LPRFLKAIITGLLVGAVGVTGVFFPFGFDLEENIGLDIMFRLRGPRTPSSDVMIVSLDKTTADILQLPSNPYKWPRSLHANLIENLAQKGASIVAFDMMFNEPGDIEQDDLLAKAIRKAGNVVLCQCLVEETVPLTGKDGKKNGELTIDRLISPIPALEQTALALAPFPLPKVPVKVSQYWTFKTEAGDISTFPVTVFQIFAFDVYREFVQILEKVSSSKIDKILSDKNSIVENRWIEETMLMLRSLFKENPLLGKKMIQQLEKDGLFSSDVRKRRILNSLIKIYQGPNSRYLNFYGPPGTIENLPYHRFLKLDQGQPSKGPDIDLTGKVIFVGLSEHIQFGQRDGFYTVFSKPSGIDISGAEIAATAFANLLEDNPVRPLAFPVYHLTIVLWGILLSVLCFFAPPVTAVVGVIVLSVFYLTTAVFQFKNAGIWFPVVIPLFFQMPVVCLSAFLWKFFETSRERKNIRKFLEFYLPENEVSRLSKDVGDIGKNIQTVYGTCLFTDVEEYTSKTEKIDPRELALFMNKYFGAVFEPIRQHGGFISDIKGDSVLSVWATAKPDINERKKACLAALDILGSVKHFKTQSDMPYFPTRIGLHSGFISLGSIGAMNRYEYRPLGDIVNTASRIENLNKFLGTRILVTEAVIHQVDGLLARNLGKFLLSGKTEVITVYELISRREDAKTHQKILCKIFNEGLDAYYKQSWEEAIQAFNAVKLADKEDGPSKFYAYLCEKHKMNPPGETWNDGVVVFRAK